jgi:hypothetical protein
MPMLRFLSEIPNQSHVIYGRIILGELKEDFASSLGVWSPTDYREHWRQSLERAIAGEAVLLITNWNPSDHESEISAMAWALYPMENRVAVHQRLLFNNDFVNGVPDPEGVVMQDYKAAMDDDNTISEWSTSHHELVTLLNSEMAE